MKINRWVVLLLAIVLNQVFVWWGWGKVWMNVLNLIGWVIALLLTEGVTYARRKLQNKR